MSTITGQDESLIHNNARWASLTVGCVLAGGLSRRMGGGDKSLKALGGHPMLARVIARIEPQVGAVVINANGDPARFAEFDQAVTADPVPGFAGPLAGVLAGMDWAAKEGAAQLVTAAADTPFLPRDLVIGLRAAAEAAGTPLAMAMTPGAGGRLDRHPTFGLGPVALREDLRAALGAGLRKVVAWTGPHGCAEAVFRAEGFDPFFNVNTPEDLAEAEHMLAAVGP
jgi:molybdopterin-guanine dinucleotide biosynthesis protein A